MYDLIDLTPGVTPPGAPWGNPFVREDPGEWTRRKLYRSVVEPKPTKTMAVAWDGIDTINTQESEDDAVQA